MLIFIWGDIMNQNRINELIHSLLVSLAQLAYINEEMTYDLITDLDKLFLYLIRKDKTVILYNEIKILLIYLKFQKIKNGEKFEFILENEEKYKNIYIMHLDVIDCIDEILVKYNLDYEYYRTIRFNFTSKDTITSLELKIETETENLEFIKELNGGG